MKNKIRYWFSLLEMMIISFLIALIAPLMLPINSIRRARQAFAVIAMLLLFLLMSTHTYAQNFGTTNNLVSGVQYTLYPTNASGFGTGGGIELQNYKSVGLYLSGDVSNNAAAVIGLSLVRSDKLQTSGTTNWETTSIYKVLISVPAMTNHFDWMTNLPEDFTGCGQKMGISQLTNNFAAGQTITNLDIGAVKKIIPVSLSPR